MASILNYLKIKRPTLLKSIYLVWYSIIIVDIIAIIYLMLFDVPTDVEYGIIILDFTVCLTMLIEFSIKFYISRPKRIFMKNNWLDLIAAIPLDLILPLFFNSVRLLKLIRILKIFRILVLSRKYFRGIGKFIKNTSFDKIMIGFIITVIIFTLLIYFTDPTIDLFESFWFVIVTLTTIGYGDVIPTSFNGKVLALFLIVINIFVLSTITGAISSVFTDRLLRKGGESDKRVMNDMLDSKINSINEELKELRHENKELKDEILELKELIRKD